VTLPPAILAVALDDSSATPAFAGRLAAQAGSPAQLVLLAQAPVPAGSWEVAWRIEPPSAQGLARALATIVSPATTAAIVLDDGPLQRELAGRLSVTAGLPVVGSVVSAQARDGALRVTRHAASGEATAIFTLQRQPAILLVDREASAATGGSGTGTAGDERRLDVPGPAGPALQLLRETRLLPWEMQLTESDVIVAGGRGVGAEGFEMLARLATLLGGTVAGTRVAVDNGWIPYARQVGLTGKTVTPALYIACGISGAVHHTLGMRGSSRVIAINSDREAPIFKLATVSVVANVHDVIPRLVERLESAAQPRALAGVAG
jgi:electron transfer flavoprotein alpha subunit